jgi:hypothetical protein
MTITPHLRDDCIGCNDCVDALGFCFYRYRDEIYCGKDVATPERAGLPRPDIIVPNPGWLKIPMWRIDRRCVKERFWSRRIMKFFESEVRAKPSNLTFMKSVKT